MGLFASHRRPLPRTVPAVIPVLLSLLVWLAFAWATAAVGERSGGSFAGWFLYGLGAWPVALPTVLVESVRPDLPDRVWWVGGAVWGVLLGVLVVAGWEIAV